MRISDWSSDVCSSDLIRVGRIVVEDVDLSKGADGRVDHGSDLFARTDINGQRQRLTTRRFYLRNDAARGFAIEIGDHHFGSLGGEPLRRRQPNAAARAGDDRNLALQTIHAFLPRSVPGARPWGACRSSVRRLASGLGRSSIEVGYADAQFIAKSLSFAPMRQLLNISVETRRG